MLDKEYDKLKKKVEEATKTKNYSQKELNREIVDLTEVSSDLLEYQKKIIYFKFIWKSNFLLWSYARKFHSLPRHIGEEITCEIT